MNVLSKKRFIFIASALNSVRLSSDESMVATASDDKTACIWKRYRLYSLEQILLRKLLYCWLQLKKPDKNPQSMELLLTNIAHLLHLDYQELVDVWNTFPVKMQTAIWGTIMKKCKKFW